MDIICDTNVWYEIGAGTRDLAKLKAMHRLIATPVNFFELASPTANFNFDHRKKAAKAILEHSAEIIDDPERHLASIWQIKFEPSGANYKDGLIAIANATDIEQLQQGVSDFQSRLIRSVNVALTVNWRFSHYDNFCGEIGAVIDQYVPGYHAARQAGKTQHMKKAQAALFKKIIFSDDINEVIIRGIRFRAEFHTLEPIEEPTAEQVEIAKQALSPYARAYLTYVYLMATKYAPQPNDWGDLECFIYLQNDRRLLTREKRWREVIREGALDAWYLDPRSNNENSNTA